ncbi:MAG: hypothetical protein K8S20_04730 [Chloroflexi bacterium]|nr:hypothetical protein [Chloroflexota bacterium]
MQKLQCSACGANLELPDELTVAHCMYCGAKIVLRGETALNEAVNLKRFAELAQIAIQAKNYEDAVKYSSLVLEIDTKNVDAWIIKAQATFWLSTARDDKFDSAMQYLETALRLNPADPRIMESQSQLRKTYAAWLNKRGLDALNHAREIYNIESNSYASGIMDMMVNSVNAKEESRGEYVETMNLFLTAADNDPDTIEYLQNIYTCAMEAKWNPWGPAVIEKIQILGRLNQKETVKNNITKIEKTLAEVKAKLKALEGKSGIWAKATRGDLEDDIKSLESNLRNEKAKVAIEDPTKH